MPSRPCAAAALRAGLFPSERSGLRPRGRLPIRAASVAVWLACAAALEAGLITREEALAAAFPGGAVSAERVFLTEPEREAARRLSGEEIPSLLIARYTVVAGGRQVGRAYVDTHVVRTKKESLLVILDAAGTVKRVEVTAFQEPPEYLASPAWYAQYRGKELNGDLSLQRAISPVAGATLTAVAANQAVRRTLAIDRILQERRTREAGGRSR